MSVVAPPQQPTDAGGSGTAGSGATAASYPFSADPMVPSEPTRSGWRWHRLTAIARLATGHTPSRRCPEYWSGNIPWLQLPDIRALDGGVALDTLEHTNELGIMNSAAVLLPEGTVCLSRTASVGFVTVLGRPMATSQDFVNWVCGPTLSPEFLKWLLVACRQRIRALGSGATHQTIYLPMVERFAVCIPPRLEQERIAARLTAELEIVEQARAAASQRLAAAEALPASLLREVFGGPDANRWERLPIAQLGDPSRGDAVQTGPFGAQLPSSEFVREGIPVLNIGNVKDGQLNLRRLDYVTPAKAEDLARYRLRPGDMLFTRSGSVGRSAVVTPECNDWLMSYHLLRVAFDQSRVVPGFVSAAVRGDPLVLKQVRSAAGRGATRDGVNATILGDLIVPVPKLTIQQRVLADLSVRLSATESLIARCRQELADIEALPAALLRAAFNGAS